MHEDRNVKYLPLGDFADATEELFRDKWICFMEVLETEKSLKTKQRLSDATLNRYLSYASAAIGRAVKFEKWKSNQKRYDQE